MNKNSSFLPTICMEDEGAISKTNNFILTRDEYNFFIHASILPANNILLDEVG